MYDTSLKMPKTIFSATSIKPFVYEHYYGQYQVIYNPTFVIKVGFKYVRDYSYVIPSFFMKVCFEGYVVDVLQREYPLDYMKILEMYRDETILSEIPSMQCYRYY